EVSLEEADRFVRMAVPILIELFDRLPEEGQPPVCVHARESNARLTTACVSGTLYAFLASGRAPSTAARAAAAHDASLRGFPLIAASALTERYGIGATPPSTMRASCTTPFWTVTIAATL